MSAEPEKPGRDAYLWDPTVPGDPDVERLERVLGSLRSRSSLDTSRLPARIGDRRRPAPARSASRWAAAGALAAVAAVLLFVLLRKPEPPAITRVDERRGIASSSQPGGRSAPASSRSACETSTEGDVLEVIEGTASCDGLELRGRGRLPPGIWIETAPGARVAIAVGEVGRVEIWGSAKVRVLAAGAKEHKLELARGKAHAKIDAPPRYFSIETKHAVAVDLGCEYELEVDEAGAGELRVKTGFVALEGRRPEVWAPGPTRSTLVPKGAQAAIVGERGPGLPVWAREPAEVKDAVRRFDAADASAFETLLAGLGERDTLTLVHLLDRVEAEARARVLQRLEAVEKPPAGTRAQILEGDPRAIERYRQALVDRWFPKR